MENFINGYNDNNNMNEICLFLVFGVVENIDRKYLQQVIKYIYYSIIKKKTLIELSYGNPRSVGSYFTAFFPSFYFAGTRCS